MVAALVGASKATNYTGGYGFTALYNQSPTAGNLLVMGVLIASQYSCSCATPAGWTAGPSGYTISGSNGTNTYIFYKVAAGGDAQPSLTIYPMAYGAHTIMEEWSGLTASPLDSVSTVGTNNQSNAAAGTCNSGPLTTTNANDFIWSFMGVSFSSGSSGRTLTWGGGSTSASTFFSYQTQFATANQTRSATGTYTPTLSFAAGTYFWASSCTSSIAFKITPPNTAPNAPTLNTPATSTTIDRSIINRFSWTPSDPDAGDTQTKFDLRYRVIGTGSWTTITQTTANSYWDVPASTFAPGSYEWQVCTYDTSNAVGQYSSSSLFSIKFIGWGVPL